MELSIAVTSIHAHRDSGNLLHEGAKQRVKRVQARPALGARHHHQMQRTGATDRSAQAYQVVS
jgi:hypothetical protein